MIARGGTKSGEERFEKFANNSGIVGGERFRFNPFVKTDPMNGKGKWFYEFASLEFSDTPGAGGTGAWRKIKEVEFGLRPSEVGNWHSLGCSYPAAAVTRILDISAISDRTYWWEEFVLTFETIALLRALRTSGLALDVLGLLEAFYPESTTRSGGQ
ncbi:hypothetical protein Tco_0001483 [Tanacetum coccineum]